MTVATLPELKKRVTGQLQATLDKREPVLPRFPGILGLTNDTGSATVPGKEGWVYVRIGNDETVATAFNNRTVARNGLPVIVGYEAAQPKLFQVLSTREVYDGMMASGGAIPSHHAQHEYGNAEGGSDLVWVRMRQLLDLMVYPTDPESLFVNVATGYYLIGTTVYYHAGGPLELTSSVPGASKRWVLIACDENGPYGVDGAQGSFAYSDIPDATDPTHYKLAAILLTAGDTTITDWPNEVMIVDLRIAGSRSMAGLGGFVDWENVRIVAKSGGSYDTIAGALTDADSDDHVLVLPGVWGENVNLGTSIVVLAGLASRYQGEAHTTFLTGSDEVGPMATLDQYCQFGNMFLSTTLTGGSGAYTAIKADNVSYYVNISGVAGVIDAGASGRAVFACQLASDGQATHPSTLTHCTLVTDNNAASGATLELGNGVVEVRDSVIREDSGAVALRITGTGTYIIEGCRIDGDVEVTGAATVRFRYCTVTGDVTVSGSGATVYARDCEVGGDISIGAGDTWVPRNVDQPATKTVTGAGSVIPAWFTADETTYTDHVFGPMATDEAVYFRLAPHGSYGSIVPASYAAYWTEFLGESNYEMVEMAAFNDGADEFGCLRTVAGGTGTLHDLRWGVGTDKTKYAIIKSSGYVGLGIDPVVILHTAEASTASLLYCDTYGGVTATQRSLLVCRRSNAFVIGTATETTDGMYVGSFGAEGVNSTPAFAYGARIDMIQSGAAGASFVPTDIVFSTATDVATLVERMRLTSPGYLGIGITLPEALVEVGAGVLRIRGASTLVYPTTSQGLEIAYDTDGQVGSGSGGSGVALIQAYSRGASAWRDLWLRGNQIQIDNSGSLTMFLDSSGRVGIGVVPESGWTSTWSVLQIGDQSAISNQPNVGVYLLTNAYYDGSNWRYIETDHAVQYAHVHGNHRWMFAASGSAGTVISFTEAMRISTAGRLGVACTAPVEPVEVWTANSNAVLWALGVRNPYTAAATEYGVGIKLRLDDAVDTKWAGIVALAETNYANDTALAFYTNETEYMRLGGVAPILFLNETQSSDVTVGFVIDMEGATDGIFICKSGGSVAHGITGQVETDVFFRLQKAASAAGGAYFEGFTETTVGILLVGTGVTDNTDKSTSASGYVEFRAYKKSGTGVSTAGADANLVVIRNYTTTRFIFDAEGTGHADVAWIAFSDLRLKTDVQPSSYGLAEVLALAPIQYARRDTGRRCVGLVAQDVYDIIPEVTRAPTTPASFWSLDTPGLVPVLIRAVQELGGLVCALADVESKESLSDAHVVLLDTIRNAKGD